jgi:acetyl esterase/lipase
MMKRKIPNCLFAAVFLLSLVSAMYSNASAADPFTRQENVVYGEDFGVGLVMDIFTPTGEKNGLAIVDVVSGAWKSDRGKMRDHERAQMFNIFCSRGYTVFAVRPGSITKFTIPEMVKHIEQGIVWVKQHADDYGIDASRLGITGASAGGHLASLVAVKNENSDAQPGHDRASVKAVGVFFPPTDLTEYRVPETEVSVDDVSPIAKRVLFASGGAEDLTKEQIHQRLAEISPALLVTKGAPPFLLIHGDADTLVPLDQSQKLQNALKEHEVSVELIVKAGGGHPWPTLHEEVAVLADWFDEQLKK